ncbi:MAG: amylo-alpha-1,6-glucosidase [Dysgonamonadaceae bacterium]|jgi:predicted glycogen debranching enzyme|nr:amylo-alpha-1,6-glucosidase [Dysgonamonadaceae bacterium]
MGYLKFEKTLLINLEESLKREILRTNRRGAYHSTTIIDCNTRKYHGLLVCPVPAIDSDNHVLLSSLDETVIQHEAEFNLGIHQYDNGHFSPNGHKYVRQFDSEQIPRSIYRVGGVMLSKEKILSASANRILIKYTLMDAHSPTILRFRPFLAFRNVNELTWANSIASRDYTEIGNGIKTSMYEGYPELHMQFNKKVKFVFQPDWYKNIEYVKEQERGFPYKEDLYVPGYFEMEIKKGESIYFAGGDSCVDPAAIESQFAEELKMRTPRNSFFNCLKNSAQQFYYRPDEKGMYLLAGYPWFKVRARDLFIAMPGCTLAIDDIPRFEKMMNAAIPALRRFMDNASLDEIIQEIDLPDILLWTIWSLQRYAKYTSKEECNKNYGQLIQDIVDYIKENKHENLKLDPNGLVYSEGKEKAITWMNSTMNGKPIVPRSGYIVEFNALWYNSLKFAAELAELNEETDRKELLDEISAKTEVSFVETFLNGHGYLYDYVDGNYIDWSVRPNMLFAVSLDYSPLNRSQKGKVLNIVTRELLTPKGIRSLSPKSEGYRPYYLGALPERDLAYHQGTVWPWLLGPYLEAYLKLYQYSGISFIERMLIGLDEEINIHCIGTLSEVFDGNPPFMGRGAISFATNVAEVLRILKLMESYTKIEH